jgi:hypothetical protein
MLYMTGYDSIYMCTSVADVNMSKVRLSCVMCE